MRTLARTKNSSWHIHTDSYSLVVLQSQTWHDDSERVTVWGLMVDSALKRSTDEWGGDLWFITKHQPVTCQRQHAGPIKPACLYHQCQTLHAGTSLIFGLPLQYITHAEMRALTVFFCIIAATLSWRNEELRGSRQVTAYTACSSTGAAVKGSTDRKRDECVVSNPPLASVRCQWGEDKQKRAEQWREKIQRKEEKKILGRDAGHTVLHLYLIKGTAALIRVGRISPNILQS